MIDESMDKEQMAQPPQPWEFRSKSAAQRLLIMIGGVLFNFLLALFIYSMVLFTWGDTYLPLKNATDGMYYSATFKDIGFKDGDILLRADGEELQRLNGHSVRQIVNAQSVTVLREGQEVTIAIPADMMQRLLRNKDTFANYRYPMVIEEVMASSAKEAGVLAGDRIVSVGDSLTVMSFEAREALYAYRGQTVRIGVVRDGAEVVLTVPVDSLGRIGVLMKMPASLYEMTTVRYGFFSSFPAGVNLGITTLRGYVSDMKYVFTKEGASSIGGFGTLGSLFPAEWDWQVFWMQTAFLSIILAFMNILPIPALDGGHIMFLIYEVVARRKPNEKFLEYAQIAGMILLFGLLIYANGNDIFRYFFR